MKQPGKLTTKARVGDVILLPAGSRVYTRGRIDLVGGGKKWYSNCERELTKKQAGEYIVISTAMTGGGCGHGPHDVYPDGWKVVARRLNADGTFHPKGKKVSFYQSGAFTCMIKKVLVVRKMQMTFTE